MSGFSELGLLRLATALFVLLGSPDRDPAKLLFSATPRQAEEDSCGNSVVMGLSGKYPDMSGDLSLQEMETALLGSGIRARPLEIPLQEILPLAAANYPVILLLSRPRSHYVLLIGEREGLAVIADPSAGTIAAEVAGLEPRYSGWAILPLFEDSAIPGVSLRMRGFSDKAMERAAFISKSIGLGISETGGAREHRPAVRLSFGQSISLGRKATLRAEVGLNPLARIELAAALPLAGAGLEGALGLLVEKAGSGQKFYARLEGSTIRDPFAFLAGFSFSGRLESTVGMLYAANEVAAFEAGISAAAPGLMFASSELSLLGGVRLALGNAMLTIRATKPLGGEDGELIVALNF